MFQEAKVKMEVSSNFAPVRQQQENEYVFFSLLGPLLIQTDSTEYGSLSS
jgi:hypothetical protein